MMIQDVNADVLSGLSWYFLLASAMNAAAAARVAHAEMVAEGADVSDFLPRTRRFPRRPGLVLIALYGAAIPALALQSRIPGGATACYLLAALGNIVLALTAGVDAVHFAETRARAGGDWPPSLDDHVPPIGLGRPMNRALWALVWGVVAIVFQVIGLTYLLNGPLVLPEVVRSWVNAMSGPTTFFAGSVLLFAAMMVFRRVAVDGLFAFGAANLSILAFGLSLTDGDFRQIVAKPDNVPIVGLIVLVAGLTWLALRRAVINDARRERGMPVLEALDKERVLSWPDLVYPELICAVALTLFLIVWAVALPAPLEQPAKATEAPNPSKAPWYFLGLQEMLVYFDPWLAGVVIPTVIVVGLCAIPYIDANKEGVGYYTVSARPFAMVSFLFGFLVLWVMLIVLGTFVRGPNWNFFGPYEYWNPHKVEPLNNVDLSDLAWVRLLGRAKPSWTPLRELPGLTLLALYLVVLPAILLRTLFKDYALKAGTARAAVAAVLLVLMAGLPLKMILRWTLNLKYVVAIPGFNV